MKFNHFTEWEYDKIKTGEKYMTCWEESNYWINKTANRVPFETNFFNDLEAILDEFPFEGKIDFAGINQKISESKYYAELLKEYIFEEVRLTLFPQKPSRKRSIFLAPIEVNIQEYAKKLNFEIGKKYFLEIETFDDSKLHFANINLLNCNTLAHVEKKENAMKYWEGTAERNYTTEILYEGEFSILNKTKGVPHA